MLYKVKQFVIERTLISIYHAIFDSHPNYASIVWVQTKGSINRVFIIQKKAIRTIHLTGKFSESNMMKLSDKTSIENCLFVSKSLISYLKCSIIGLIFSPDTHRYETLCPEKGMLKVKSFNTNHMVKKQLYIVQ